MASLPDVVPGPLVPDWAVQYAEFIKALAALTVSYGTSPGAPGTAAIQWDGGNARLILNLGPLATAVNGKSGVITLASITTITVQNGIITSWS